MVDIFPSETMSPQQALLQVEDEIDDMDHVAIVWMRKGELHPRFTCSTMMPVDLNFLGLSLQNHSLRYLKE
ncbi:unnamed protein product [marine sediment metagenome]|uniref:Uncharacterized protein n=1 Tax=marine sediment metagenome TaxID=412755 RepID=X0ULX7_9ZZZZ